MKKVLTMEMVVLMLCTVTGVVLAGDPQDGGDLPFNICGGTFL